MISRVVFVVFILILFFSVNAKASSVLSYKSFEPLWKTGWVVKSSSENANWFRMSTEGNTHPVMLVAPFSHDLNKNNVVFTFRVDRFEHFGGLELRYSNDKTFKAFVAVRIPLFDDRDFNFVRRNGWTQYSFGGGHLLENKPLKGGVRYMGVYLVDKGREPVILDFKDVTVTEAIYPGVVSYTFDDGNREHFDAVKIMKSSGHVGTAYVIPRLVGSPGYLTRQQLKKMEKDGWGIAFHHEIPFVDFAPLQLRNEIEKGFRFYQETGIEGAMKHLAYPSGKQNDLFVLPIVRNYFQTARLASGGLETLPPGDPHLLRAYNVVSTTTVNDIRAAVKNAKAYNHWLILMFHHLVETAQNDYQYSINQFKQIVQVIHDEGIRVMPLHKVWQEISSYQ